MDENKKNKTEDKMSKNIKRGKRSELGFYDDCGLSVEEISIIMDRLPTIPINEDGSFSVSGNPAGLKESDFTQFTSIIVEQEQKENINANSND